MILAFQCGEAHVNEFEAELSKLNMDRWENWLTKYPQGQYHRDNMQAFAASMQCAANGMDIEPSQFLWYEKTKEQEELSVDDAWEMVASSIPVAPAKPVPVTLPIPEEKPNVESRSVGDGVDLRCQQLHEGDRPSEGREQSPRRLD